MAGLVDVKSLDAFLGGESAKNDTSSDHWAAIARTDGSNTPDEFIKPKKNHDANQLPSEGGNRNVESGHINSTHVVETDYESNLASKANISGADTTSAAISGPESTSGLMHGTKTMHKEQETNGASACLPCCFGTKPQPKPSYTPAAEACETQEVQRDAPRAALVCGYLDPAASQRAADAVSAAAAASEHLCSGWMATFTAHSRRGPSRTPEPPKQHVSHAVLAWLDSAFSAEPASLQPPPPPPPAAASTARGGCFGWWRRGSGGAAEARGTARGYAPGPAVMGFERDVEVLRDKDGQVDHRP
jgi:hypothetical protein